MLRGFFVLLGAVPRVYADQGDSSGDCFGVCSVNQGDNLAAYHAHNAIQRAHAPRV